MSDGIRFADGNGVSEWVCMSSRRSAFKLHSRRRQIRLGTQFSTLLFFFSSFRLRFAGGLNEQIGWVQTNRQTNEIENIIIIALFSFFYFIFFFAPHLIPSPPCSRLTISAHRIDLSSKYQHKLARSHREWTLNVPTIGVYSCVCVCTANVISAMYFDMQKMMP